MSTIRKQTIISSVLVYIGFGIGAINMVLFTKNGFFTPEQYGLTTIFYNISQIVLVLCLFGLNAVFFKFYPYYKDNLDSKQIDLMGWSVLLVIAGFTVVCSIGFLVKPMIVEALGVKNKLLADFYPLVFPFSFGALIFALFEAYGITLGKAVAASFLRDPLFKFLVFLILLLYCFKLIDFKVFMYLFMCLYLITASLLIVYIYKLGKLHFTFKISRVTKKFWKKMLQMQSLVYFGTLVIAIGATIDSFIIGYTKNLAVVGVFSVAQYGSSLIQVPLRTIQAVSIPILSAAWKNKNYNEIQRVYSRSSINLLLLSLFLFGNIWLNVVPLFNLFDIQKGFQAALSTLFVFGIARCLDGAFGVNNIIIGTSTFWRFEFISSVIQLALRLPLAFLLINKYGLMGSAIAELIAITSYNTIRFIFLKHKFNFQPFTYKTIHSILLAVGSYFIAFYICKGWDGILAIVTRAALFSLVMVAGIFILKLTPDALQLYDRWVNKNKT